MNVRVLRPGLLTTVQDPGRTGFAALGIGYAGAMDPVALRLANALAGNAENSAALEITLAGPRLRFEIDSLIALTGADVEARVDSEPVPAWRPVALRAGSELDLGRVHRGTRCYLAVAGGFDGNEVLGSRSCDLHGGIGGQMLRSGDTLECAQPTSAARRSLSDLLRGAADTPAKVCGANWSLDPQPWLDPHSRPLRVLIGSHYDCLDANSQRALFDAEFHIGADSNRVGYRLQGTDLLLREPLELISEGVVAGTVQLPPGGNPIVLMAEAPTCGGYPRIAQVISLDLPRLAQCRPGDTLRFEETSLERAQSGYLERERALTHLIRTIGKRLQDN